MAAAERKATVRVAEDDLDEVRDLLTDAGILFWLDGDD